MIRFHYGKRLTIQTGIRLLFAFLKTLHREDTTHYDINNQHTSDLSSYSDVKMDIKRQISKAKQSLSLLSGEEPTTLDN